MDVERLLAEVARWANEHRVEEAAASRRDEAWLLRQAAEEARFTGVALDLAEAGESVTVGTTTGRRHRGRIVAVAEDFLVVQADGAAPVFVPFAAVVLLRSSVPDAGLAVGSPRTPPSGARLVHALSRLVGERPRVTVVVHGDEAVNGELRSVGRDVVTLVLDGGAVVHVPVAALTEVTVYG